MWSWWAFRARCVKQLDIGSNSPSVSSRSVPVSSQTVIPAADRVKEIQVAPFAPWVRKMFGRAPQLLALLRNCCWEKAGQTSRQLHLQPAFLDFSQHSADSLCCLHKCGSEQVPETLVHFTNWQQEKLCCHPDKFCPGPTCTSSKGLLVAAVFHHVILSGRSIETTVVANTGA